MSINLRPAYLDHNFKASVLGHVFFDEEEDPSKAHTQEEVGKVHRVSNSVQQPSDVGTS